MSDESPHRYQFSWLPSDVIAGVTLAAYAIPVSLAYATLAGLPPQVGLYGYLLGGIGYALAGSSRYLAIGPTSAISLMIAGTVSGLAADSAVHYAHIATTAAVGVGALCLIAWAFRLSALVRLISDSVLTGFKAGAGLTIAITQLPALLGVSGGGHNVLERIVLLAGQLGEINLATLATGVTALVLLWCGERWMPGRPVALGVVVLSIVAVALFGLTRFGVATTGPIPPGLPTPSWPSVQLRDQEGIVALAAGCMLLAYIEGVAAARTFAARHGQTINPRRELLGLAAANLATAAFGGYPVAGGLSQTAVNEKSGARSRLSLVFASATLAVCLLFLSGLVAGMPRAMLAAVVLMAVYGLVDIPALRHMRRSSRIDFLSALAALVGVLLLGILQGVLLATLVSVLLLLASVSTPHVAVIGRIPGTAAFSDMLRNSNNEATVGALAVRPEASLLYLNAEHVLTSILARVATPQASGITTVFCDLSASPMIDLAGARMLLDLRHKLDALGLRLVIIAAHGHVRDVLRAEGLEGELGQSARGSTLESKLLAFAAAHEHGRGSS